MSAEIKNLNPPSVWEIFYDLTQIPRPSKMEHRAVVFAKEFGEKLGLKTYVDKTGNVIISKPASPGFENRQGVILQAHLDMVP
ncbi:MAG: cytosol nonspecific dipeptidase, partial [Bacteroidales bacterium]|nr:cytosol nonspecific dipeptidase [Bacteroidales bacterium]